MWACTSASCPTAERRSGSHEASRPSLGPALAIDTRSSNTRGNHVRFIYTKRTHSVLRLDSLGVSRTRFQGEASMKAENSHLDVLQNIEFAIANEYQQNPSLTDRDVMEAVQALVRQYAAEERGQRLIPTVYLNSGAKSVFEAAKAVCELRLGRCGVDSRILADVGRGIDFDELVACLKTVRESIKHWMNEGGLRAYLDFISPFLLGHRVAERQPTMDTVARSTWKDLYELARCVNELAPWKWMSEADVFGIQLPDTGETIFVSVMGMLDEYRCIAVYPSVRAVRAFWQLQSHEGALDDRLLEIPQIHLSFEGSSALEPQDHQILKSLGLKFKGPNCPIFRSYRPGFVPWFLEAGEAEMLRVAVQQLLDVAPRARDDSSLLWPEDDSDTCLIRVPRGPAGAQTWLDEFREVPPEKPDVKYIKLDSHQVRNFRGLPAMKNAVEMDCFLIHARMDGNGGRPKIPYMWIAVDAQTGVIITQDLMTVETTVADLWAEMPGRVMDAFVQVGMRPTCAVVRPGPLAVVAEALSKVLGFELRVKEQLPSLDQAKQSLKRFMQGPA